MGIPTTATHLVLVCCHAIYLGGHSGGLSESEWLIAPFQKDETPTFISHLQAGLQLISSDDRALLIVSGSKTRKEIEKSEARSYVDVAEQNKFWGMIDSEDGKRRVVVEEQALDSYANVLFSLLKFWKTTAAWPEKITIISHEFKRQRFVDCHIPAIRFPAEKVHFVGINPLYMYEDNSQWDEERTQSVWKGEKEMGLKPWIVDSEGRGEILKGKRRQRNGWRVDQGFWETAEERERSRVKSEVVDEEEFLIREERQPWE